MLWPNTSRTARRRTHRSISTSCVPWSWGFRAAQGLPDILIVRSSTAPAFEALLIFATGGIGGFLLMMREPGCTFAFGEIGAP